MAESKIDKAKDGNTIKQKHALVQDPAKRQVKY